MGQKELEQYRAAVACERSSPHRYVPTEADVLAQSKIRHEQNQEYIRTHSGITHVVDDTLLPIAEMAELVETSADYRQWLAGELMNAALGMSDTSLRTKFIDCAKVLRT